jgi:hypothetical protein
MISHRLAGGQKMVERSRHERKHSARKRQHDRGFHGTSDGSGGTYRLSSLHPAGGARSLGSPSERRGAEGSRESPSSEYRRLGERNQKRSQCFNWCAMTDTTRFIVWVDRSAESIFGPASNPVNRNGTLLCFEDEERARVACDRLNAHSSASHMRYSFKRAPDRTKPSCR